MAYSKNMKEAVVMAVGKGMSYRSVADSFSIGIDTVTRWMRECKKNGFCKGGYTVNRTFKKIDPEKLIQRLTEKPDCTMVELANEFNCSPVSLRTMAKNLAMSLKKLKRYCEANEEQRRLYMDEIESIPQDKIVYIDETGCEQHYYREFAWTKRGDTIFQGVYGRHFARTNIIGAKRGREVLAIKQYNEPTKAKLFDTWFEQDLMPYLNKEDVIVIMDNARFHRKKQLTELAAAHSVRIIFLPPYSPDYNPIEKVWANLKRHLKHTAFKFARLQDCINNYFQTV